jgi:hypothetical protein
MAAFLERPETEQEWEALEARWREIGRCIEIYRWSRLGLCGKRAVAVIDGRPKCAGHCLPGELPAGYTPAEDASSR